MKIHSAEFIISLAEDFNFPECGLSQIAVAGKSNVGKSSLINSLTHRKKLAKSSSRPGLTRLINVFLINGQWHLIDLPGYGYAEVSRSTKEQWGETMTRFLMESVPLVHILHLLDIRHEPGENDLKMTALIRETGLSSTVVATKADKLSTSKQQASLSKIARVLDIDPGNIIAYSSETKQGRNELLDRIEQVLEETSTLAD